MKCSICKKPVILVPSAAERAAKFGGKASDYTKLFTAHSQCQIEEREQGTIALMRKINDKV